MRQSDPSPTIELENFGYQILFREDGWSECLVSGHGERWLGTGADRTGALEDAMRQMFPSHAARALRDGVALVDVEEALPGAAPDQTEAGTKIETEAEAGRSEVLTEKEPTAAADEGLGPQASGTGAEEEKREVKEEGTQEDPGAGGTGASAPEPSQSATPRMGTYVSAEEPEASDAGEGMTRDEALEIVTAIDDEITDAAEDLAVMSSLQQRLHAAIWIFRARAVQDEMLTDSVVEEAVRKIAQRLTAFCKVYWPGSVRALQQYTVPSQGLEGLVPTSKTPLKWSDAAEITREHLDELERRAGSDEHGWADRAQCMPAPPRPAKVLAEISQMIEPVLGSVGGPLDHKRRTVSADRVVEDMEVLVAAAHLLRWTRTSCDDPEMWGQIMGALRWASRHPRDRSETATLREILSDDHRPAKSWAELLGRDPEVNHRKRMRREVLRALPEPSWSRADLVSWLNRAFQAFNNPQIAKIADAVHDEIMDLTKDDFSEADRSTRSRLRKLQSILRAQQDVSDVEIPDVGDEDDVDEDDDSGEEERPNADPAAVLMAKVREITADKRILFVTNWDDKRLRKELEEDLACSVTVKNGSDARRLSGVVSSVDADRYDFVLIATGFISHNADVMLCRAAKSEGIPYVRVQKGRRGATLRALARAFNLSAERKRDDETPSAQSA